MNKALSIFNELRPSILGRSVGFDQIFDSFAKTFDDEFFNTNIQVTFQAISGH